MPIIHAAINDSFPGDTQYVKAIVSKLSAKAPFIEYYDNESKSVEALNTNLVASKQHILIVSGTHGADFLYKALNNPRIKSLIQKGQLTVVWGGHQAPENLSNLEANLTLVGLVEESVDESLQNTFGSRIIKTSMVPNTLNANTLSTAVKDWQKKYHSAEDTIPGSDSGYIGVFLGGDAPDELGNFKFYSEQEAFEHGKIFGIAAAQSNQVLLVTNGPRTGKLYPESTELRHPSLRRFTPDGWVAFDQLKPIELLVDPAPEFKAHSPNSPLDPVSQSFINGVKASGLPENQFRFIDFKFGKSAYPAIVATLATQPDKSVAYYSAESVSYAEIGYFVPRTYAFKVSNMSVRHQQIVDRFSTKLHIVGTADLTETGIKTSEIDLKKKQEILAQGSDRDAQAIANAITTKVNFNDGINKVTMKAFR